MKLIKQIDIMNNKKIAIILNLLSIPLIVIFIGIFSFISIKIDNNLILKDYELNLGRTIISLIMLFPIIIIHELIHGLFFKLFNLKGKVKFGFKNGLAYATSPGSYYTKGKFACISLAPFVIITAILTTLFILNIITVSEYVLLASVHAGSCVGDFYWIILIIKSPKNSLIEDTENGINFYIKSRR
ncbi:DUF3267 domain-containing protein [Miniphocaeibacter massiliensis]|uniref:DUF3267 domain-containing protein n=1 Tax=Miniphocaeibacter massiliensis TaxID=2041841 RepID=UPI000C08600D|nr:DUF3267 domain-containing protein [Miniphocaeibacter massiliensis]